MFRMRILNTLVNLHILTKRNLIRQWPYSVQNLQKEQLKVLYETKKLTKKLSPERPSPLLKANS